MEWSKSAIFGYIGVKIFNIVTDEANVVSRRQSSDLKKCDLA